jgi:hypothetical protein
MDKKTFFLVLLAVISIVGYLGWGQYQKSIEEDRQFRLHLQEDEQRHQKELIDVQRKVEEEKRLAEEQRKSEEERNLDTENKAIKQVILQKKVDTMARIKGMIESKGNGVIEKNEADQVWARKITEVALMHADSLWTYSYRTGIESEISIEINFNIKQLGNLKYTTEKSAKTNYDFLELTSKYEQKVFTYCEKAMNKSNCDKNKEINTFKIFLNNKKSVEILKENMEMLKKLYQFDFETLKKMYKANEL